MDIFEFFGELSEVFGGFEIHKMKKSKAKITKLLK